jgi:rsbT antagonist protein RsbS
MGLSADIPQIAIQVSRGIVVASIQTDLNEEILGRFREDLLGRVHHTGARGVILDVSALEVVDAHEFAGLRDISTMARLLGAETVLVGLRPGVVSALIELGADVEGVQAALNIDAGFAMLQPEPTTEIETETEVPEGDELEDPKGSLHLDLDATPEGDV